MELVLFQSSGTQPDHQYFHAMATLITEQVGAMRFDRAKGSQHLSHGSIHTRTHVHRLGREPDFIDMDHVASALSNSAKADISDSAFEWGKVI